MSQTSHANFFATMQTPCCVVGFEYSFRQFNEACLAAFGYSQEQFNRLLFTDLVHPEDLAKVEAVLDEMSNNNEAASFQCRILHSEGHHRMYFWQATPSMMEFAFYAVGVEADSFLHSSEQHLREEMQEELVILQEKYADLELMYQELQEHSVDNIDCNEFEWQAIVNSMREGVATLDADGKLYCLNPQRTEELIGEPLKLEEFQKLWEIGSKASNPATPILHNFVRYNRSPQQLKLFGLQHFADDGKTPAGCSLIFSDATKQAEIEQSLHDMQDDWNLLTGHLIGMMEWHISDGRVQYSGSWQNMLGVKQSELSKDLKTWQSRIHPGDFPLVMNSLKAFLAKKNKDDDVYENMHRLQHSKGNYRWFKMTGEAKRDRSGKAARLVATFQDITERKHLEDALQTAELSEKTLRSERYQYETLLHAVPLMVIYKDRNSQILRLNKYAEEWLGKTDAQAKGLTEQDLNLGYTNQYYADDQEVITTGQAKRGIVEKSRNHYFRTNKLPYRDADGKILGIIVIAEDITDVVKAQEMLKNNT